MKADASISHASLAARFGLGGRRALVTGGSVSIGRAIALGLAEAGADVAIHSDPGADARFGLPNAAAETCAAISALSRRTAAIAGDFTRSGEASRVVDATRRALGGLDVLVICASVQSNQDFAAITEAEIARQVAVNLTATIELLQAALPDMAAHGWGRVLAIGSVNQVRPNTQLSLYASLKAAQHNLIIGLARQYAKSGVTLNTLSPGLVATERNRWRRKVAGEWEEIQARANPMGRAADPEEMVGAALLFCSGAAAFITGADLQATGGGHL
ncbi:MAG TPA: SDR family oxidoreductase [Acetobacteraceae bacterium]|jgi:NAD(P)-dependent dehydrogenase (short-subunit alcohol dehydrogenase family)